MQANNNPRSKSSNYKHYTQTAKDMHIKLFEQFASKREQYNYQQYRSIDITAPFPRSKNSLLLPSNNTLCIETEKILKKKETAIHELQELVTPRGECYKGQDQSVEIYIPESIKQDLSPKRMQKEEGQQENRNGSEYSPKKEVVSRQNQELNKLKIIKTLLHKEQQKNKNSACIIAQLEQKLAQLQQEKTRSDSLLKKTQEQLSSIQSFQSKHEQNLKKQVLINLELEALLGKVTIKHKQHLEELHATITSLRQTMTEAQTKHEKQIQQMTVEFEKAKGIGQRQINQLLGKLSQKNTEISSLQQAQKVNTFNQQPLFSNKFGLSTLPSNHLVDSIYQKIAPPSLETLTLHLNNQQKKEDSPGISRLKAKPEASQGVSKGNYEHQRPICKTDRI